MIYIQTERNRAESDRFLFLSKFDEACLMLNEFDIGYNCQWEIISNQIIDFVSSLLLMMTIDDQQELLNLHMDNESIQRRNEWNSFLHEYYIDEQRNIRINVDTYEQ